jgi:hypothetical protein
MIQQDRMNSDYECFVGTWIIMLLSSDPRAIVHIFEENV